MSFCLLTSESVSAAHPDKIADRISDAILDAVLLQDPEARVAAETLVSDHLVVLAGELSFLGQAIDYRAIVQQILFDSGYSEHYLSERGPGLIVAYNQQSRDIAQGIYTAYDDSGEQGAGDQGTMFGYACDETPTLMPLPIYLAHRLLIRHADYVRADRWLKADAKSQVTVRYDNDRPVMIDNVVLSSQHVPEVSTDQLREYIIEEIIIPSLPPHLLTAETRFFVNPTGSFVIGGLSADSGLTGRKIIVDSYGSLAYHGGGAFSGKDPSKVDRSAAYAARYVAKNVVAAGIAQRCSVHVSYAIGVSQPTCFMVNTFGTGIVSDEEITRVCRAVFDLRPRAIIDMLDLRRPIYLKTAVFGHFGREEPDFYWESTDKIGTLQSYFANQSFLPLRGSVLVS